MTDKYQNAVDKATNKGKAADATDAPTVIGNVAALVSNWEPGEMEAIAASGKVEFAPQMMSLEPGQKIQGYLEGEGPGNDFVNEQTGEVRHVKSWIIRSPDGGLRVSILSSAQLDRKLPPYVGGMVGIARDKDIKAGNGFKVGDYKVWGPKLPTGPRVFHIIEAKAEDKALPAAAAPALPPGDATNANGVAATPAS